MAKNTLQSAAFAEAVSRVGCAVKGFSGPIGSGKSQALCQEAIKLSYSGRLGLIGAPTYPMPRDATQATMFEILEANKIAYEHNTAENTLTIKDTCSGRWKNSSGCGTPERTGGADSAVWTPKGYDRVCRKFLAAGQKACVTRIGTA